MQMSAGHTNEWTSVVEAVEAKAEPKELVVPQNRVLQSVALSPSSGELDALELRNYRPLTVSEAEEIITMSDPVTRNLRITQGYHDLKLGMTQLLGHRNVSWCAFATWASRTAGRFIRGEFIPGIVHAYLDQLRLFHKGLHAAHRVLSGTAYGNTLTGSLLVNCIEAVTQQVTNNVGYGNWLVFEDLAPLFARMIAKFEGATTYDHHAIRDFLGVLRPGPTAEGGEGLLIAAFGNYYKAMFETHPKKKAELILLANNQIGYHEQTRLQTSIVNSLNAPIGESVIRAAHERAREVTHVRLRPAVDSIIDRTLGPLCASMQRKWYNVATRWLMRLDMPTESLCLGKDLPHHSPNRMFPNELASIENPELRALLYDLDFTPNTTSGSAASNWGDLADRMNFVVDFFRTRQQDNTLYRQPFSDTQIEIIRAGGVPDGDL